MERAGGQSEQIRLSVNTIERSQELCRRIDDLLVKSPLKP